MNKFYIATITDEQKFIDNLNKMTKGDLQEMIAQSNIIQIIDTQHKGENRAVG